MPTVKKVVRKNAVITATPGALGTVWLTTPNGEEYRLSWQQGRMVISAERVRGNLASGIMVRPQAYNVLSIAAE